MKKCVLIIFCVFIGFASFSAAASDNKTKTSYESEVSKLITFYEKQLFLIDSEYKILSDIGKDAQIRVAYLRAKKDNLVHEMRAQNIVKTPEKIKSFAIQRVCRAGIGLASTSP